MTPRLPQVPFEAETSIAAHAMVHAYRALQDDSALDGGRRIINYLRRTFYEEDGTFLACPGERHRAHFHAHARGLLAMQEYVEQTGDADVRDFVHRGFRRAKQHLANHEIDTMGGGLAITELPGANLVGFFPEWANSSMGEKGETCQLTDMIALALRLGQSGLEEAWDDADRWIRNQLAEDQLTDVGTGSTASPRTCRFSRTPRPRTWPVATWAASPAAPTPTTGPPGCTCTCSATAARSTAPRCCTGSGTGSSRTRPAGWT